jgi:hypothetical protein
MPRQRIRLACLAAVAFSLVSSTLLAAGIVTDRVPEADRRGIVARYDALAPLTVDERKEAYMMEAPEIQNALFVLHLERFLATHPELTVDQRAVIYEGLGLLRTGLLARLHSADSDEAFRANEELTQLSLRTKSVLSLELAEKAFAQIGPGTPPRESLGGHGKIIAATSRPYCSCATMDSYCNPGFCFSEPVRCLPVPACGTFFQYACDGLCY